MGSRVRVERFDDLDDSVRADVQTVEFGFGGVNYEIDLHADHFAEMELVFAPFIKAGRKAKRQRKKGKARAGGNVDESKRATPQWVSEIKEWAAEHGYDWDDVNQRKAVRQWAFDTGIYAAKSGTIPRHVMETHYEARENGTAPWPFNKRRRKGQST